MLQKLAAMKERAAALALAPFAYAMAATYATAQDNANIRGALETNEEALEALQESTFTQEGVESAAQASTNALLFGLGFVGGGGGYDGCWQTRRVWTPFGFRWRTVNVCY